MAELAGMLAEPYPTSTRHLVTLLGRPDCPFHTNVRAHPIDVDQFKAWHDAVVAPNNTHTAPGGLGDGDAMYRLKVQELAERIRLLRRRRELLEERFIPRQQHEKEMRDYVTFCRDRFEQWCDSLPPLLEGLDAAAARIVLRDAYDQLCADMQAVTTLPPAEEREPEPPQNPTKAKAAKKRWQGKGG